MRKIIFFLFAILLFFVPLILWPFTSEVFEFDKMVLVYILTTLIVGAWLTRIILVKKMIFRRTMLDIPLLAFIGSQLISTLISIDPRTSWLGYYSRFNGGFISTICYSLLYWAFVSNLDGKDSKNLINFVIFPAASLVSIYGVLEHFGIDKNIWVQDVQSRVFSTLGQPNWLAAWLIALMPVTWVLVINSKFKSIKFWLYFSLSVLLFWTMIFTKSRSGYLGIAVAFVVFWGLYFWSKKKEIKKSLVPFGLITFSLILIVLISGTEYTPGVFFLINHSTSQPTIQTSEGATSLETGGTESGAIRQIVWKGAVQVWLHYPVFGTGVETFAYSYYLYRPAEHNLTSEWDFIYNKAHNEFLNIAANTGTIGLLTYLTLIIFIVISITNYQLPIFIKLKNDQLNNSLKIENWNLKIALLAGYISLLVTNFFGFSVVPTQLEFFLFPAMAIVLSTEYKVQSEKKEAAKGTQKFFAFFVLCTTFYVLFSVGKYWYADTLYAKGKAYNSVKAPGSATTYLTQAISLEPNESLFYREIANSYTTLALAYYQQKDITQTQNLTNLAIEATNKSLSLSPADVNAKRSAFGVYIMLSTTNSGYLLQARDILIAALSQAPTDAKILYNLGLVYARTSDIGDALTTLQKAITLKANYKEARLAYAILLIDEKQNAEAKTQLEYILTKIDPNDSLTKQTLESIK